MHVVRRAANDLRNAADRTHGASEKRMQPPTPFLVDDRSALLGAKDEMVVKAQVRRWHSLLSGAPSGRDPERGSFPGRRLARCARRACPRLISAAPPARRSKVTVPIA